MDRLMNVVFLAIISFWSISVQGADIIWDGGAGSNYWSDPENWEGDVLPESNDEVIIQGVEVNLNSSATVQSILLEEAQLNIGSPGNLVVSSFFSDYGMDSLKCSSRCI